MKSSDSESSSETLVSLSGEGVKMEHNETINVDNGEKASPRSRADTDQSTAETEGTSLSYEAFKGEFHAEKIQIYLPTKESTSSEQSNSDEASTADDVSTICDEEINQEKVMPQQLKSRFQDRKNLFGEDAFTTEVAATRKAWRRPQSAGEIKSYISEIQPFKKSSSKYTKAQKSSPALRRYSSTGDLQNIGRQKRQLPNLSACKRLASSDIEDANLSDSSDSETIKEAPTPGDRKTLEAQFQLLYRENIKMDKAYGELQEKVRSQSPQLLSSRFLSPRELEWQMEKKKHTKEIQQLQSKISEQESTIDELQSVKFPATNSENTEEYYQEKFQNLQKVKDEEIERLTEQVSYWLRQAYMQAGPLTVGDHSDAKTSDEISERVADLEQSEAFLQCQIINLEDQLLKSKKELSDTKKQNEDLGEHCGKLENCLAVLDAEKSLLDDLKLQNAELRKKLSDSEKNENILIEKMAQLSRENVGLENQASSPTAQSQDDSKLQEKLRKFQQENSHLQDRCTALEDLKECLMQQIRSMEDESNVEEAKNADQVRKSNESIRILKTDKESLIEAKEQLELKQELDLHMSEKLNKRIEDLQHHIETLKSQLENQKLKIESINEMQSQLDDVTFEKGSLEVLCSQYKTDVESLHSKLLSNQERLSDSFEQVNLQLIEETDEMAMRQRDLLAENQVLRMRSCSRGFDAVIGRKFRQNVNPLIESCTKALLEMQKLKKQSDCDDGVFTADFESDILDPKKAILSDHEAIRILDDYGDEVMDTTVAELRLMEDQSPRLGDVFTLAQLISSVKESHQTTIALQKLKENAFVLRDHLEEEAAAESELLEVAQEPPKRATPIPRELSSPNIEGSASSRILERTQLQEKIEALQEELKTTKKVLQFLKEENEFLIAENRKNQDINNLKKELETLQGNEKSLLQKLNKSQEACDSLVARTRILQEEKYELIKSCTDSASLPELKEKIEKAHQRFEVAQKQNRTLTDDLEVMQKQLVSNEKVLKQQIDALCSDLAAATKSESSLRKSLDETQKAGEDLLSRFQELKEENSEAKETHQSATTRIKKLLTQKEQKISLLIEENEQTKEELLSKEESEKSLFEQLEDSSLKNKQLEVQLEENDVLISKLRRIQEQIEQENAESKFKVDDLEKENEEMRTDGSKDANDLKGQLSRIEDMMSQQNESLREKDRFIESLEMELQEARNSFNEMHSSKEDSKQLEEEISYFKERYEKLEKQLQESETCFHEVSKENEKMQMDIQDMRSNREENALTIAQLKDEVQSQNVEFEKAKELSQGSKNELDSATKAMNEILEKNLLLMTELSDNKETIISLRQQIKRLENCVNVKPSHGTDITERDQSAVDYSTSLEKLEAVGNEKDENRFSKPTAIENYSSEIMSSELESLRNKCLKLQNELSALKNERLSTTLSVKHSSSSPTVDMEVVDVDSRKIKRKKKHTSIEKTAENLVCGSPSSSSTSFAESSSSESDDQKSSRSISSENGSIHERPEQNMSELSDENQTLRQKIQELEKLLQEQSRKSSFSESVPWLQVENKRLLDLLKQAEKEVEDSQSERNKLEEIVDNLRNRVNEHEGSNQQSGTESEPEAIYHERRRKKESEAEEEAEQLKHQLEESDCLVVAYKSKVDYIEGLNEDLRLVNGKLKEDIRMLENQLRLPSHPLIEKIEAELQGKKLSKTSPAMIRTDRKSSLSGSWTEKETLPMDQVLMTLCEKFEQSENLRSIMEAENENLSSNLKQISEQLQTSNDRNTFLEQQTLNFTHRLEESENELTDQQREITELEELLINKESTSKKKIQSKEEDLDKLQEQLMTISVELEKKNSMMLEIKESQVQQSKRQELKLCDLLETVNSVSQDLEDKTKESDDLMLKTQFLENQNLRVQEEMDEKDSEINHLKTVLEKLERENAENVEMAKKTDQAKQNLTEKLNSTVKMHDETIEHLKAEISALEFSSSQLKNVMSNKDQNLEDLSLQLSEKEEKIEVLSARVEELMETGEALKMTMDSADDMIAAREMEHFDEVEQLKDGLNKSLSEAKRAEMTSDELLNEIYGLDEKIKSLQNEIEGCKRKENDVDNQIETMEMEKALLNTSLEGEREEKGELAERYQHIAQENLELHDSLEKMQIMIEKLQEQIADLHNQCDLHSQESQEKDLEIEQLNDEVSRLQSHLREVPPTKEKAKKDVHEGNMRNYEMLEEELEAAHDETDALRNMMTNLRIERDQLEREVQHLHLQYPPILRSPLASERRDVSEQTNPSDLTSDLSVRSLQDNSYNELVKEQELNSRLQETSVSLRSENEALRSKIASLEGSISAMNERLVPKLELGSIADESEPKQRATNQPHDDDTGRYVDDIDTARETGVMRMEVVEEKLRMSEEAREKLSMQVEEMNQETDMLRKNLKDLSSKNPRMQTQFFGTVTENYQAQVDELSSANTHLTNMIEEKESEIQDLKDELTRVSSTETQWRNRYKDVQNGAEEMRLRLEQAEVDNHDLQQRLIDLDRECQNMLAQSQLSESGEMKPSTAESYSQTLSFQELLKEIKQQGKEKRHLKNKKSLRNGKEDTEDDVSDLTSSSSSSASSQSASYVNPLGSATQITNLADDKLLQDNIIKPSKETKEEAFNLEDVPDPVTDSILDSSQTAAVTDQSSTSNNTVKSLQNEVAGYQLMIDKLKHRNQELLDGCGAAMSQDAKEALECEISALRGQVALLERNNRIFSDRERNDLKQDLDHANKRCNNLQAQLQAIKASTGYGEMIELKKSLQDSIKEADELKEKLRSYETSDSSGDSSDADSSDRHNKYARLLELEEEADELKGKLEERDEDLKDRDVMIDELQHRMINVKEQYEKEIEDLEKKNNKKEKELQEEVKELEREVAEKKEMIQLKQNNLRNKTAQLDSCEMEIERLQNEIKKKNRQIEQLKWEIGSLQRENFSLRERVDRLKHALSSSSDAILIDAGISPVGTFYSPPGGSPPSRIRSRTSTPHSSFHEHEGRRSRMSLRSNDSMDVDFHPRESRPRKTYSIDFEDESPTAALREGIHEAKETVHQMGDVLDTPLMTPRRRSPVPKSELGHSLDTSLHAPASSEQNKLSPDYKQHFASPRRKADKKREEKTKRKDGKKSEDKFEDTSSFSSSSSFSASDEAPSRKRAESKDRKSMKQTAEDKALQFSLLSLPSEASTRTLEQTGSSDPANPAKSLENLDGLSSSEDTTKYRKRKPLSADMNRSVSEFGIRPVDDDKDLTSTPLRKISPSASSHTANTPDFETDHDQLLGGFTSPKDNLRPQMVDGASLDHITESFLATKAPDQLETLKPTDFSSSQTTSQTNLKPSESQSFEPNQTISLSLLPDDRPTLIQEVTKAREEARKWFSEVTQSDRERRELGRRLEALENELIRLKNVEDSYEMMKKHQENAKKVEEELEQVRAQVELANRKAEEAKGRNALLRAHLLDKEEVENQNIAMKRRGERPRPKNHQKSQSSVLPLSELQERVVKSPMKTSSPLKPPTEKQLKEIKDSFEYIATNFADLVLRNHQADATVAPNQNKVSKLKRKCLERDQLLAKLLLKLRKKREEEYGDILDSSFASSTGLESILTEADRIIRKDTVDSDSSLLEEDVVPKKKRAGVDSFQQKDAASSSYSPISNLMKSLSSKPSKPDHSSPTHRIYIAKNNYAPSHSSMSSDDPRIPITHSLLPDLPLLAGDTVVAIGNPDQRDDGKLYQMAEVHGKIGFVPLANLVPAEQVEGTQAFVQERGKSDHDKHVPSSPEKVVDLYKKLEQAQVMVADKLNRNTKNKPSTKPKKRSNKEHLLPSYQFTPNGYTSSEISVDFNREDNRDDVSVSTETSTVRSFEHSKPKRDSESFKPKSSGKKSSKSNRDTKHPKLKSEKAKVYSSRRLDDVAPDVIRTSTPVDASFKPKRSNHHHQRSSSLPPRRDGSLSSNKSGYSTPGQFFSAQRHPEETSRRGRSRSSSRSGRSLNLSDPSLRRAASHMSVMSSPEPPTFLVIEKTMGQKSMIICWTPPLLDMISRSNNIPVIGYEISVDRKRKVQVSGAYTNKAILGDLDLKETLLVEIRTVSSVGTLSSPCEVVFTPNPYSAAYLPERPTTSGRKANSPRLKEKPPRMPNTSHPASVQRATALYNYDPRVDSPYKSPENEVPLQKGDDVILLGTPRPDGFCNVQIDGRRGFAPIAFLISSCDETIDSNDDVTNNKNKLRRKKKINSGRHQERLSHYTSSNSSFQN